MNITVMKMKLDKIVQRSLGITANIVILELKYQNCTKLNNFKHRQEIYSYRPFWSARPKSSINIPHDCLISQKGQK